MSRPIIASDRLSKVYQLGAHRGRGPSEGPPSLREAISGGMRSARDALKGARPAKPREDHRFWALKDVSFEVDRGEVVGIIGRNGAGKSTLLKVLSRIVEPTSGSARLRGRVASLLEVGTGFHPELTGRENTYLNGAILGMRKAEIDRKFDEIVAFAEIEEFLDTPVKRYSSGMSVRLAFAVAAHLEPEILIVDEVLAVGDFAFQKKCLGKMQEVASGDGRTILFVSHNMGALSQLCDRGILLEKGTVSAIGPIQEVLEGYIGSEDARGTRTVFPIVPEKPYQWTSAEVVHDDGRPGSEFDCDEPIEIRLEFEVRQPATSVMLYFTLSTLDGIPILSSEFFERGSALIERIEPGRHTFGIEIPARLLAQGSYVIGVSAYRQFSARPDPSNPYHDAHPRCCEFALRDLSYSRISRPGVLGLLLPWTHNHQDGPPGGGPGA